ncbi:MAG: hypothetical protein IJ684_03445, partial [Bacteroidales bacterium]|nr:hypothetical protein [Bacteroidales bacterium]
SATFSIASDTTNIDYTLNMTYDADKKLTGATVTGGDAADVVLSNGAGSLKVGDNTYSVSVSAATFEDDSIGAGEIVVKGAYNNTLTDDTEGYAEDKLEVSANSGSKMLVYSYDSKNKIAFNLGTAGITTVTAGTYNGIAWTEEQALAYFTTDGGTTWTADKGTASASGNNYEYTPNNNDKFKTGKLTIAYSSSAAEQTYTITPTTKQTFAAKQVVDMTPTATGFNFTATSDLKRSGTAADNYKSTTSDTTISGSFKASLSANMDGFANNVYTLELGNMKWDPTNNEPNKHDIWQADLKIGNDTFTLRNNNFAWGDSNTTIGGAVSDASYSSVTLSAASGAQLSIDSTTKIIFDSNGFNKDNTATDYTITLQTGDSVFNALIAIGETGKETKYSLKFNDTNEYMKNILSGSSWTAQASSDLHMIDTFVKLAQSATVQGGLISSVSYSNVTLANSTIAGAKGLTTELGTRALSGGASFTSGKVTAGTSTRLYQATVGSTSFYILEEDGDTKTKLANTATMSVFGTSGALSSSAASGFWADSTSHQLGLSANGTASVAAILNDNVAWGSGADSLNATLTASNNLPTIIKIGSDGNITDVQSVYTNAAVAYQTGLSGQQLVNYVSSRVSIDGSNYYSAAAGSLGEGTAVLSGFTAPDG